MRFPRKYYSLAMLAVTLIAGCAERDYYIVTEPGPHGINSTRRVYYTPEQQQARRAAATQPQVPTDPSLAEIEANWSKLTADQRAAVVESVRQMTAGQK